MSLLEKNGEMIESGSPKVGGHYATYQRNHICDWRNQVIQTGFSLKRDNMWYYIEIIILRGRRRNCLIVVFEDSKS